MTPHYYSKTEIRLWQPAELLRTLGLGPSVCMTADKNKLHSIQSKLGWKKTPIIMHCSSHIRHVTADYIITAAHDFEKPRPLLTRKLTVLIW